jgi:membrane protease subunit HflC
LRVTRIITPKPKFDNEYEKAIEDRKEANQEVERLRAKEQQLEQEREQRLATVLKEKEIEMQALTGDLRKALLASEERAILVQRGADAYAIAKLKDGEGERLQLLAMARGLEVKYTKEAEGLQKRVEALEQRGRVVVREALIEKLLDVKFTMLPYSRDPEPRRIEHVQSSSTVATRLDERAYDGGT